MVGSQRWNERYSTLRSDHAVIDPARHEVAVISDRDARAFVERHHYSGSYPAARLAVGLFRKRSNWFAAELVGVAVYSVPMNQRVIPRYTGLAAASGVELGRFVLRDEVEQNGETWFLARAMRLLTESKPEVRAVVSYSDPARRHALSGELVMPGHVGLIYQASNARHVGRSEARWRWMAPDGSLLSRRTLSKIRRQERGHGYAREQLLRAGAPQPHPGEPPAEYVTRALTEGPFRRFRHPGNLAYVFAVGDRRQRRATIAGFADARPYPKSAA